MPTFDESQGSLRSALVASTVLANDLPAPSDIGFERSMNRKFAQDADSCSETLLGITNQLLNWVRQAQNEKYAANGIKKRRNLSTLGSVDDVKDDFTACVVDCVDFLFETADECFDEAKGLKRKALIGQKQQQPVASTSTAKAVPQSAPTKGKLPASVLNASHIDKPQLLFHTPIDNSRDAIWKPFLPTKPNALVPLDLTPSTSTEETIPTIPNPYTHELSVLLDNLPTEILSTIPTIPDKQLKDSFDTTPFVYVDTLPLFESMLQDLFTASAIAVDLEHHDFRTYTGLVCLIQISVEGKDFVLDALQPDVRQNLHRLNETFTDPKIVKVFHGAERDIIWLQRDCGVYVVGLFDTFHASKALGFPSHSLASLLERYCGFEADKRYQMADWRIRPLPTEMLHYARSDTHYLLYVYYTLLAALHSLPPTEQHTIVQSVFLKSAKTAAQSYAPTQYDPNTGSSAIGWRSLVQKWGKGNQYAVPPYPHPYSLPSNKGDLEFHVFRALHNWRDELAREEDESPRFVMAHHTLFKLAERRPTTASEVLTCISPATSLVIRRKTALAKIIKDAVEEWEGLPDNVVVAPQPQAVEVVQSTPPAPAPIIPDSLWNQSGNNATDTSTMFSTGASATRPKLLHASSSTLFDSMPISDPKQALDSNFQDVLKAVHSSLSLALSFAMTSGQPAPSLAAQEPSTDHLFVPAAERTNHWAPIVASTTQEQPVASTSASVLQSSEDEEMSAPKEQDNNEIITLSKLSKNERKKLKRSQPDSTTPMTAEAGEESPKKKKKKNKKAASTSEKVKLEVAPFDYAQEGSLLDQPPPTVAAPPKKEKKSKGSKREGKPADGSSTTPFVRPRDHANTSKGERSMTFLK